VYFGHRGGLPASLRFLRSAARLNCRLNAHVRYPKKFLRGRLAAFIFTGRSSAAVLSAKRAAASCARPAGSTAAEYSFWPHTSAHETKSVEEGGSGSRLPRSPSSSGYRSRCRLRRHVEITSFLASAFTSMTRGATEELPFAVGSRNLGAALAFPRACRRGVSVNTSLPSLMESIRSGKHAPGRHNASGWRLLTVMAMRTLSRLRYHVDVALPCYHHGARQIHDQTRRRGAVLSLGTTPPRAVISTRISPVRGPRSLAAFASLTRAGNTGVSAPEAVSPSSSNGRNTLSQLLSHSPLPNSRVFTRVS